MHEPLVSRWIAGYPDTPREALVVDIGANLGLARAACGQAPGR